MAASTPEIGGRGEGGWPVRPCPPRAGARHPAETGDLSGPRPSRRPHLRPARVGSPGVSGRPDEVGGEADQAPLSRTLEPSHLRSGSVVALELKLYASPPHQVRVHGAVIGCPWVMTAEVAVGSWSVKCSRPLGSRPTWRPHSVSQAMTSRSKRLSGGPAMRNSPKLSAPSSGRPSCSGPTCQTPLRAGWSRARPAGAKVACGRPMPRGAGRAARAARRRRRRWPRHAAASGQREAEDRALEAAHADRQGGKRALVVAQTSNELLDELGHRRSGRRTGSSARPG
jgi:hypothetical protein